MPVPWTKRFDFCFRSQDDRLVSVWLDVAAVDHVPVAGYPLAVRVAVPMKEQHADGLRSNTEFEALTALEDELVHRLEDGDLAIYWGRHVGGGRTDFFFHTAEGAAQEMARRLQPLRVSSGYELELGTRSDPEWSDYFDSFPNTYELETMRNRDLQMQLERQGDRLEKRRVIDHVALFPSPQAARSAVALLKKARFRTDRVQGPDETGRFVLEFHRKDSCEDFRPDEVTAEVLGCIEPSGGEYDGWGCVAQR